MKTTIVDAITSTVGGFAISFGIIAAFALCCDPDMDPPSVPECVPVSVRESEWILECFALVNIESHDHEMMTLDYCVTRAARMFRSCALELDDDRY